MKGIFVTGTDTGVGKTVAACLIVRFLKSSGMDVGVMKPAVSGGLSDARALKRASGSADPLRLIAPIRFRRPLAPWSASQLEPARFSMARVLKAFRRLQGRHAFTVVEGIGGARVPLSGTLEVSDLIRRMALPAVVVAPSRLGTLNQTLLTLEHLERKNIKVLGVLLNFFNAKRLADRSNLRFFRSRKIPILATVPENPAPGFSLSLTPLAKAILP